ncbi:tetratricopeptide repeat protein [bacterium]|nr:tetratricopeptide repeat protein [bacterium]
MDSIEQQAIKAAIAGDWETAIKLNNQVLDSGTKSVALFNRLGKAYSEVSNWAKAVSSFESALELDPVNSVAERGITSAKLNKRAGVSTLNPSDTVVKDMSTVKIIETSSFKLELNKDYELVIGNNDTFYFLLDSLSGKKLRRISKKNLGLKSGARPQKLQAKVIEINDDIARIKISSDLPSFTAEKAQTDPFLEVKSKVLEEEKLHFTKLYEAEQEIEE